MQLDKQTLKDLEIFKAEEGDAAVFDFINKTKTTGGKYRLREKFLYPPDSLELIKVQQESIRYLTENWEIFSIPFNDRMLKSLEEYLSTNIDFVKGGSLLECVKFCLVDIQAYRYLKNSLSEIAGFINGFYKLLHEKKEGLPAILKTAYEELDLIIHDEGFKKINSLPDKKLFAFYYVLQTNRFLRTNMKTSLASILSWYYETDALLAMAKATCEYHFIFPEFVEIQDSIFEAESLYHPMLANAIPSDVKLDRNLNLIFLTGPNMSGKTTFLKATGIAVYLAHLGMGIPAKRASVSYFDRLFTSLNITDNILSGYSFFFSEVKRVKQLAEALNSGEKIFTLFDELFRGTNVKDAYDATVMVISGLALWNNSILVISSHLWEVWDKIKHFANIKSLCFDSEISFGVPVFSYRMVSGVSQMRLGLTIIENEKIMELLKH